MRSSRKAHLLKKRQLCQELVAHLLGLPGVLNELSIMVCQEDKAQQQQHFRLGQRGERFLPLPACSNACLLPTCRAQFSNLIWVSCSLDLAEQRRSNFDTNISHFSWSKRNKPRFSHGPLFQAFLLGGLGSGRAFCWSGCLSSSQMNGPETWQGSSKNTATPSLPIAELPIIPLPTFAP